jgi:hypothetical protein
MSSPIRKLFKRIYNFLLNPFERKKPETPSVVVPNEDFFPKVIESLDRGETTTIPVKGFSMLPFIRGMRDWVELQKKDSYGVGDIVLFRHCGRYVMHRIIRVEGRKVTIQGDGVARNVEIVHPEAIFGKAIRIFPDGDLSRPIDPDEPKRLRRALRWHRRPSWYRTFCLRLYRFSPWNYIWLRHQ